MLRRTFTVVAAVTVLLATVPASATAHRPPREEAVYMSLGDSLAAGMVADENGDTVQGSLAYTDQLYWRLKWKLRNTHKLTHVKLGCDGETTDTFNGGFSIEGYSTKCASDYATGFQLGDALATLATENVELITITIGANDVLQAQVACQMAHPDDEAAFQACLFGDIAEIAEDLATIVGTLRVAGGYDGPIIGMTYYNPQAAAAIGFYPGMPGPLPADLEMAMGSDALTQGFNDALAQAYTLTGAEVADVYTAFNTGDFGDDRPANGVPDNVDRLCRLTYMCPDEDGVNANIHPNWKGYFVIARTFMKVVRSLN